MIMVCGEGFFVLMLGNTVLEQLVNSFTNAGTSGWSALISWRHHRELRWTQLYGLPVSPCDNIIETLETKVYFSLEQSLTHTHTHTHTHTTCIRQPRQKSSWVPRCHASEHTAATTSHGVCKPWSQMLATVPLAPLRCNWPCSAQHWFATHAPQPPKRTPKFERLEHAAPTLARPPHLEQLSLRTPHATKSPPQPVAQWTYNPQHA